MSLAALLFLAVQPPAPTPSAPAPSESVAAASAGPVRDSTRRDTTGPGRAARRAPRPVRRIPVTPALEASAFASPDARALLHRARVARLAQDSALAAYEAHTYQRISAGMGVRAFSRERLLFRAENAARITWSRTAGLTVEPTGSRAVVPMGGHATIDLADAAPLPYFPGRESLWLPSSAFGIAKAEVDDREFVHPLAVGSEAYYRYEAGGSASIRLPNGRVIALRELRVTPRRPAWRLVVGSFWFDASTGQLVRAAYRMSADLDVWQVADEDERVPLDSLRAALRGDTTTAARAKLRQAERAYEDSRAPGWVKGMVGPTTATLGAITVEYGLYEGRFWLPRRNIAEGSGRAGFLRFPFSLEERYRYDRVEGGAAAVPGGLTAASQTGPLPQAAPANATLPNGPAPRAPTPAEVRTAVDSALAAAPADTGGVAASVSVNIGGGSVTTAGHVNLGERARAARVDSTLRALARSAADLTRRADSLRAKGDTAGAARITRYAASVRTRAARLARREVACRAGATSYDAGTSTRFDGALPVRVRRPCDESTLATSPDLPTSPYAPGEQLFGEADRDALLASLDFSLQPAWAPQPPRLHVGLDLVRFNRVEALSVGASATSVLGRGYTAAAVGRLGVGDWVPNLDLSLARTDGRRTVRAGVFQRLAVANDDWGSPLSLGASLASALYGRDEGFYYRALGAELGGSRPAPLGGGGNAWNPLRGATLGWRLFAERERGASVAVRRGALGPAFVPNIAGDRAVALGAAGDLARTFGVNPAGARLSTRVRAEGAWARYDRLTSQFGAPADRSSPYTRGMAEATVSRPLGPLAASVTGAAGLAAGNRVPVQRLFYVGGLQTVRGQFAQPLGVGYAGPSFWLGRAELGLNSVAARPVVFYDAGWAGPRDRFAHPGRPLSGAGVGASFLDGLLRADLARGIAPGRAWRFDLSLDARF